MRKIILSKDETNYIVKNYNTMSNIEIAKAIGRTKHIVVTALKEMGLRRDIDFYRLRATEVHKIEHKFSETNKINLGYYDYLLL